MFLFIVQEENIIPWDLRNASVRPPDITYSKNDVSLLLSNALKLNPMGNRILKKKKLRFIYF